MFESSLFSLWQACGVGSRLPIQVLGDAPTLDPTDVATAVLSYTRSQQDRLAPFLRGSHSVDSHRASLADDTQLINTFGHSGFTDLAIPPLFLYARGDAALLERPSVAVVGSRHMDADAKRLTKLSVQHFQPDVVISGGALGVDAVAHAEALELGIKTVVVLPSCVCNPTPSSNRRLFDRVLENGGLLISEYGPDVRPRGYHFYRRNRLIASLASELVVVRAARDSGSLLTASAAHELQRTIYAIPGSPTDRQAQGCNDLISAGTASLLQPEPRPSRHPLNTVEKQIVDALPATLDELHLLGIAPLEVLSTVIDLEVRGVLWKNGQTGRYVVS